MARRPGPVQRGHVSAVSSGINSKDAICLTLTGRTNNTDKHEQAVAELRAAGAACRAVASTFGRLLRIKTKSQYQAASVPAADTTKDVDWAERIYNAAQEVVRS